MPNQFIGILLVIIAFILFVYALPQMTASLDSTSPTYNTLSPDGKQSLDLMRNIFLPLMGIIILVIGLWFMFGGN